MIVVLTGVSNVVDSLHSLFSQKCLSEILLLLLNLESLNERVLEKTGAPKAIGWLRHEDTCHVYHVTWCAGAGNSTSSDNLNHSRHMANWHLIARLLDLDVLVRNESGRFGLENQLTVDLVRFALV